MQDQWKHRVGRAEPFLSVNHQEVAIIVKLNC